MEGKEGKEYKPSSLHQIMRRLCFFPTLRSSRAGIPKSPDQVLLDSNALGFSAHRHRQTDNTYIHTLTHLAWVCMTATATQILEGDGWWGMQDTGMTLRAPLSSAICSTARIRRGEVGHKFQKGRGDVLGYRIRFPSSESSDSLFLYAIERKRP
jgi:hypothetical protein